MPNAEQVHAVSRRSANPNGLNEKYRSYTLCGFDVGASDFLRGLVVRDHEVEFVTCPICMNEVLDQIVAALLEVKS